MIELIFEKLQDTRFLAMIFAAVAAAATVITLAMPLLSTDSLGKRMKAVALERERMRQRERERLARGDKVSLRPGTVRRVSVLPHGDANRHAGAVAGLSLPDRQSRSARLRQARHLHLRDLYR